MRCPRWLGCPGRGGVSSRPTRRRRRRRGRRRRPAPARCAARRSRCRCAPGIAQRQPLPYQPLGGVGAGRQGHRPRPPVRVRQRHQPRVPHVPRALRVGRVQAEAALLRPATARHPPHPRLGLGAAGVGRDVRQPQPPHRPLGRRQRAPGAGAGPARPQRDPSKAQAPSARPDAAAPGRSRRTPPAARRRRAARRRACGGPGRPGPAGAPSRWRRAAVPLHGVPAAAARQASWSGSASGRAARCPRISAGGQPGSSAAPSLQPVTTPRASIVASAVRASWGRRGSAPGGWEGWDAVPSPLVLRGTCTAGSSPQDDPGRHGAPIRPGSRVRAPGTALVTGL